MERTLGYGPRDEGSSPSGVTKNGRVINLAIDLVLKTSGTFGYGDRYLTFPHKEQATYSYYVFILFNIFSFQ